VDLSRISISSLQWVPGAIGLVNFGGEPASVEEHIVHSIRSKVDKISRDDSLFYSRLKPGDPVTICEGPFAGYKAIFDMRLSGNERVQVLLEMLRNQQLRVELPSRYIQRIH
jgi:transcriptional antiterminator RfaH